MLKSLPAKQNRVRGWGLLLAAVLGQTLLLFWAPAQQNWISLTGREVTLQTAPVDPFNALSGYYVNLSYQIADARKLPGFPSAIAEGAPLYVLLAAPQTPGTAWRALSVSTSPPQPTGTQAVLMGHYRRGRLKFGLETYYIPEAERERIAADLNQHPSRALVDARVTAGGQAVPVRIRIENRRYEF
ncbi:GDYXXLXY domain-containing protein [Gloeobacter kilaueensis]|uniref:Membrane-anchored protein n=1 Tax=Gloeobacter kilaueensis (strain ATCC BAA-2537 / CCAP 1431/1 / ULC 316 / JS1) TaxID=1183438 RepID=U5QL45_GLOK1|nr:GDYXXLXY domain-containing protein [Gloeobacter kilaueensis]AGY58380.1 hypothetical protein GKIL_2134 [Gloeobacter kilaueensis JS1]